MSPNHTFNLHFKGGPSVRIFVSAVSSSPLPAPAFSFFNTLEVRTRSFSLIMASFHHTPADIFKTRLLSFSIAAAPDLVQQHKHSFSPVLPPPRSLVIYSSVFMRSNGATLVDCTHQAFTRINDALLRAGSVQDSCQTSTASHL